jgi:hypothetical protein
MPSPIHTNAPIAAVTSGNSQSGQVKLQNRKSSVTFSVFWIMKISNSPIPVSEAIAPPPIWSRCGSAAPPAVFL